MRTPLRFLLPTLALLALGCGVPENLPDTPDADVQQDDLGESQLALCESTPTGYVARTPSCGGISDAWTKAAINVAWYPYRANKATNIYRAEGNIIGTLQAGDTFSLQSTRNPDCLNSPPLRPPKNYGGVDYYWGYAASGSLTGWVKAADLTYSTVNSQYDGDSDCGGSTSNVTRYINVQDSHLRFAPLSTSLRYLFMCDRVTLLYSANGWGFVEVTAATHPGFSPAGSRGWLMLSSLSSTKPAGCP